MLNIFVFLIFLFLICISYYHAAKGLLNDDIEREKKWLEYEKHNRKK